MSGRWNPIDSMLEINALVSKKFPLDQTMLVEGNDS